MAIKVLFSLLLLTTVGGGPLLLEVDEAGASRVMAPLFTISSEFVLTEGGSSTIAVCELSISTNLRRIDWAGGSCLQYSLVGTLNKVSWRVWSVWSGSLSESFCLSFQ